MASLIQMIPLTTIATADFTSASIDTYTLPQTFEKRSVGLQIIASALGTADTAVKFQESNDDVNYNNIPTATITLAAGASINTLWFTDLRLRYIRVVFTKGTNLAGTISGIANLT